MQMLPESRQSADCLRNEAASWDPETLQRVYQGETIKVKPEWHPPIRKPPTLLKEKPANFDELLKIKNQPVTARAVEQILDPHRPFLGAIKQSNIVDGIDGNVILNPPDPMELHHATRLHDYGRRRVAYATEVPVPERNSGVVINLESRPPKVKHLFADGPETGKLELVCKSDELIRNVHWPRIGPMIHQRDLNDEKNALKDSLKTADYAAACDLGGLHGRGGLIMNPDCRHASKDEHFKTMWSKRQESVCADHAKYRHREYNDMSSQLAQFVEGTEDALGEELAFNGDGRI
jgi:hypothetical protein